MLCYTMDHSDPPSGYMDKISSALEHHLYPISETLANLVVSINDDAAGWPH